MTHLHLAPHADAAALHAARRTVSLSAPVTLTGLTRTDAALTRAFNQCDAAFRRHAAAYADRTADAVVFVRTVRATDHDLAGRVQ